jgi:hypothetical protein
MNSNTAQHPVVNLVKSIIHKLIQQPDIYPIRYYKKSERIKRIRKTFMG